MKAFRGHMSCSLLLIANLLSGTMTLADPSVKDLSMRQDGRTVTVRYVLENGPAIVTATFRDSNGDIVHGGLPYAMVGDVAREVASGERAFYWTVDRSFSNANYASGELSVELKAWKPQVPPDYMVADLTEKRELLTDRALYFAEEASLPGGIMHDAYRNGLMVMRRIPVSSSKWRFGFDSTDAQRADDETPPHYVTLTEDYYMGVYEVTQGQYWLLTKSRPSTHNLSTDEESFRLPLECASMYVVRGKDGDGYDWPNKGHAVDPKKFVGLLRSRTGIEFDLPTEAQWEYACRAGSSGCCYLGNSYAWIAVAARCNNTAGGPLPVGSMTPNAFGLYDMMGNVWEHVLDWWTGDLSGKDFETDPVGPTAYVGTGTKGRVIRGGSFRTPQWQCAQAYRKSAHPEWVNDAANDDYGYRMMCPIK